ncbi:MAG TPA: non-homologous end-joining DNA ligase [Syntrophomonadaceae bacterium]|nr:non-homologous end-joining DNA ligase [Syntrophomonadaceae bacterium]HQA06548.1 non-homologous end-joining DNA ligase [Syntrophomonadaceae bacterium]HQE22471.1 non-homologous end-joining DNA ligase [Syntrophomonadaceae bacterium]
MVEVPGLALVEPMMPILVKEIIEGLEYVYQVKWDGVRMLAYLSAGRVTLVNRRGHLRTGQYPELQELASLLKVPAAILDGELVVLKNGKPSFASILKRDLSGRQADHLKKLYPIHYMVFDIPFAGRDLRNLSLMERQRVLEQTLVKTEWVHTVENFSAGHSLFEAVKAQDMEGIVIKRSTSPYISGKKHRDWLKVKYRRTQYCVIGGYTLNGTTVNALLLGVYHNQNLLYVGKAGTGLKQEEWSVLTRELSRMSISHSPFVNKPPARGYYFVHPRLTVKIEFAEWTESLTLRSPVITGFSNKPAEDCRLE